MCSVRNLNFKLDLALIGCRSILYPEILRHFRIEARPLYPIYSRPWYLPDLNNLDKVQRYFPFLP
jgi:hypothetical protein